MYESILRKKLNTIMQRGVIKCNYRHSSKVGYTIEDLLGLERNNYQKPDFFGIEIKTRATHSKPYITLFNLTPDSRENVISYIKNRYGYPSRKNKNHKNFNVSIFGNGFNKTVWNQFKLIPLDNKLLLKVLSKNGKTIDETISWSKSRLDEIIKKKITKLCIIKTINHKINDEYFFKIESFRIYNLKSIESFYEMIKVGKIRVTFKIGNFMKGERIGETHDRGTGFDINTFYLNELFEEV